MGHDITLGKLENLYSIFESLKVKIVEHFEIISWG